MLRKLMGVSLLTAVLALGTTAVASAETSATAHPVKAQASATQDIQRPYGHGRWIPVFYFGTQGYCVSAGVMGEEMGVLANRSWTCDTGWLLKRLPVREVRPATDQ